MCLLTGFIMFVIGIVGPCGCALCQKRLEWYDKAFAFAYTHSMDGYEETLKPIKMQLFETLKEARDISTILEVGIGPGQYM